jgi:glycerophosphoryl diester phosphodiesterase
MANNRTLDVQGHRGCRGLLPENTIPAFKKAIDLGVTTLELDLVISKDKEVIISHEPFFSHEIATTPDGVEITKDTEHSHNMYQLSYNQIKTYDVGNRPHERFPIQQKMSVHKPSFRDMVIEVEAYVTQLGVKKPLYNIEIKRKPNFDNTFHPEASEFAQLVVEVVNSLGIADRTFIQSFDIQSLIETKKQTDNIRLVYLIENEKPIHENIDALGFTPDVYSPYFKLIDQEVVDYCKKKNMQLIPWTVNEVDDMKQQIAIGVDGIITDYPDRLMDLCKRLGIDVR